MRKQFSVEIGIAALSLLLLFVVLWTERYESAVRVTVSGDSDAPVVAVVKAGGDAVEIAASRIGDTYWLFLPGTAEGRALLVDGRSDGRVTNDRLLSAVDSNGQELAVHVLTGSAQPGLFLTTEGDFSVVQEDEDKEAAEDGDALILLPSGALAFNGELEDIHGRGNASWDQDKKGYNIELGEAVELPGFSGAYEEYALVSHTDKSYVRNRTSLEIMRAAGGLALDYITVDLYVNGEYQGLYELHEKVTAETVGVTDLAQINKDRNASLGEPQQETTGVYADDWNASVTGKWWNYTNEPFDVTGGYIIEANDAVRYEERRSGFLTNMGAYFTMKSPSRLSRAEYDYISTYVQQVEDTMVSSVGSDSYEALSALIDVPSFEAKYLVEEISKNIDTCVTSQFYYKDAGGLLYAGPVWDHDWAYGVDRIQEDVDYTDPTGFSANVITGAFPWYQLLYYNQGFQSDVKSLYINQLSAAVLDIAATRIPEWQQEMEHSAVMDLVRWNSFETSDPDEVRSQFYAEGEHVSQFLIERDAFLMEQWAE